ncbi:hypothetical protein LMG29542_07177 [Paraburkholderia humisilvae]|uniref:Uncharacterized protein n=1 Tax=Paraburkholderia humisilvae TaxID=627669 RepID=A0A6J5F4P1_9BURK|nr:hypothetical protein LMG29542_07177 [Paraburkholderia humisilvae]
MREQAGLDLAAEAADLELMVIAPEEHNATVGQVTHEVAGALHAGFGIREERIGDDAPGGGLGAVQVATGHTGPANVQFNHTPAVPAGRARRSLLRSGRTG